MKLCQYPVGTRVQIGDRLFNRTSTGSFWREESNVPGNRVARPSVSLETLELATGNEHIVVIDPQFSKTTHVDRAVCALQFRS